MLVEAQAVIFLFVDVLTWEVLTRDVREARVGAGEVSRSLRGSISSCVLGPLTSVLILHAVAQDLIGSASAAMLPHQVVTVFPSGTW